MIRIPQNLTWRNVWASDNVGDIVKTKNIDLNEETYIKLARKPTCIFSEHSGVSATGDADFQDAVAIVNDGTYYYVITQDHVFGFTISETSVTSGEVSTTSAPTVNKVSDATLYKGEVVVTGTTMVRSLSSFNGSGGSGTWTDRGYTLTATNPHPVERFENRQTLCVADGNTVYQTTTTSAPSWSDDSTNRLSIPQEYTITSMRWQGNKMYIGTRCLNGQPALMFIWNGSGATAEAAYPVNADWIYGLTPYSSSVALITSEGQILRFNGGGFDVLDNLPVYYTPYSWTENATAAQSGNMMNRGIFSIGDVLYFVIRGEPRGLDYPDAHKQPGGLWVYDPAVGLYHKAGVVTEPYVRLAISSLASNVFTFASAHGLSTGDPVWADTVSNIAALTAGKTYYAIVESTTAIKLAISEADAEAGKHIVCSGTISGDTLAVDVLDAVGGVTDVFPGPIVAFSKNQPSTFFASEVLFTASGYDPTGSFISSLQSLGDARTVGHFITRKVYSPNVKDVIKKMFFFTRNAYKNGDSIVVKYRTTERNGLPSKKRLSDSGLATWVTSTTFTVDSSAKDIKSAKIGDEIEFAAGAGAGYTAHITEIDDTTSTWTITIDEAIPLISASDVSEFFVDNWKKLKSLSDIDKSFEELAVGKKQVWIQFKVELRGREVAIPRLDLVNEVFKYTA